MFSLFVTQYFVRLFKNIIAKVEWLNFCLKKTTKYLIYILNLYKLVVYKPLPILYTEYFFWVLGTCDIHLDVDKLLK